MDNIQTGFADVNGAKLYYELAGTGQPLVMIHAGVADNRQWNNEFAYFAQRYRVLRFDMREYGQSKPVAGDFNRLDDLVGLLDALAITEPIILVGCSMGGALTINFALDYPARTKAVVLMGAEPDGLDLDVEIPPLFYEAKKAAEAEDYELLAEIEAKIWFDGEGRTPDQINQTMRELALAMNRIALANERQAIGNHVDKAGTPAVERMAELTMPTLIVIGQNDIQYLLAAADYMVDNFPNTTKVVIPNAAHLPNMDQPEAFQQAIDSFLATIET